MSEGVFRKVGRVALLGPLLLGIPARDVSCADGVGGTPREGAPDSRFAVIVRGLGGDPTFDREFAAWAERLCQILRERGGFRPEAIFVLAPDSQGCSPNTARATAESLRRVFERLRAESTEESLIVIVLIGHGSFDGERGYFHVVGPDLSAEDFGALLQGVKAHRIVFVNTASASGAFLPVLSGPGRIVITATRSGHERQATVFASYFIEALADARADANKDGRISFTEAFTFAARMTAEHYARQGLLATEHPLLDDNGDGVGHPEATGGDGEVARTVYVEASGDLDMGDEEVRALLRERDALLRKIEEVKARKAEMRPEEYERELERWLVELAKLTERLAARRNKP